MGDCFAVPCCIFYRRFFINNMFQQETITFRQGTVTYGNSMLVKVKKNYFIYRMAMAMGDVQIAEQHKDFILKNGGSLWYRQEFFL